MNPYLNRKYQNVMILGGIVSPGKVTISGHDRSFAWDIVAPKGATGASSKGGGAKLAQFLATFSLVSEALPGELDQFDSWLIFDRLLRQMMAGPVPETRSVYHPDLVRNQITEVSVEVIGGMTFTSQGEGLISVKFLEYKPPKKRAAKRAKPAGAAKPRQGKPEAPDPNARAKQELADLMAEARKT
jgi:hypothetical protein